LTLNNGGSILLAFQWAEPWGGVQTDLDIYLLNASNTILASSFNDNPGVSQTPFEFFSYTNNTGSSQQVFLVINRFSGAATPRLKYILVRSPGLTALEYTSANSTDIFGPTVFGHSGEDTAISLAAVPFNDSNNPESFTSRGFPVYYFGPTEGVPQPAAPLPAPETRLKPDVAATDGGRNTFFGSFSGGVWRFFGTSAAAPHAAAVAALMRQRANQFGFSLVQGVTETILETNAVTITNGSLVATGAGLIDAFGAISAITTTTIIETVYLPVILKN
jgi:subtilisin family serine protease